MELNCSKIVVQNMFKKMTNWRTLQNKYVEWYRIVSLETQTYCCDFHGQIVI